MTLTINRKTDLLLGLNEAERRFASIIESIVTEFGRDHVYEMPEDVCIYVELNDGVEAKASCLIGRALHEYGVTLPELRSVEGHVAGTAIRSLGLDEKFRPTFVQAVDALQAEQDYRQTWGSALDALYNSLDRRDRGVLL